MSTAYIRKNSIGQTYVHVTEDKRPPKNIICLAPKYGNGRWVTDINILDVDEIIKTASINNAKLIARSLDEQEKLNAKTALGTLNAQELSGVKAIDIDQMIDTDDKAGLKKVFKYLLKKAGA